MMKQMIGQTDVRGSRVALGCMRMAGLDVHEASRVIASCFEEGITFIDHADIYGGGQSEERFRDGLRHLGLSREKFILQSKCGIQRGFFDFSKDHILTSVDGILSRLGTDYLDFLVLHRPDILMDPEEVAEAFTALKKAGKVKHFGVSNQNRYQMELLQHYLDEPLAVNQLQLSPVHTPMFDFGVNVNMKNDAASNRDSGIVEYCRLNKVTIQAWSPFQIDLDKGVFMGHLAYSQLNTTIRQYAEQYEVSEEAIVIAWILRHPANMQAVVGSMSPERIRKIAAAMTIELSRPEWYAIYRSAGNVLP